MVRVQLDMVIARPIDGVFGRLTDLCMANSKIRQDSLPVS